MNFLALLLGLGVERLLTHFFHLREFRWLDPLFDRAFEKLVAVRRDLAVVGIVGLTILAVLPVGAVAVLLHDTFVQVPYFVFAVTVLLFSLGPRDLVEEVRDYCAAVEDDDAERIARTSKELLEAEPPEDAKARATEVERAIYIQANNRIFGVVLWFVLLGPTGAWLFRVLDMMRRRAAYQTARLGNQPGDIKKVPGIQTLHGIFAWLPARLVVVGYALAGSFEDATAAWKNYYAQRAERFFEPSVELVGYVGHSALGQVASQDGADNPAERARAAMGLVRRTLWLIWCPILALLTLYDWLI